MAGRTRRDLAILVPAIGAQLVAVTVLFLAPFVVDALLSASGGFNERTAGFLMSAEAVAASLTTIGMARWIQPRSRLHAALAGAGLVVAGDALSLLSTALPLLMPARLLAGIGAGVVNAQTNAVVAGAHDRERVLSLVMAAGVINGSLWIAAMSYGPGLLGYRAPYVALLIAAGLGTLLLRRLPSPRPRGRSLSPSTSEAGAGRLAYLVLSGVLLTQLGQGSFATFLAVYGHNAGLSEQAVAAFLSLATVLLLAGASIVAVIGTRWGEIGPLFAFTLLNAASIVAIAYSTSAFVYMVANVLQAVTYVPSLVYQLGLAGTVDRSGRTFVQANGLIGLGMLGSAIGGSLAVPFGISSVGAEVAVFNVIGLALFGIVGVGLARRSGGGHVSC